jgi:hypothetical protein
VNDPLVQAALGCGGCRRSPGARAALALAALLSAGTAAATDFHLAGSAFVDAVHVSDDAARDASTSPFVPEVAVKVEADVSERISATVRACVGCHGIEIAQAKLEYAPSPRLKLTAGRVVAPFGGYSDRYDQSARRATTLPLVFDMGRAPWFDDDALNFGVLPIPYVDTGAVVHGQLWPLRRLQVGYAAYAVAGLRGDPATDLDFHPAWGSNRHNYWDQNHVPAGGARLTATWTWPTGSWLHHAGVGGSFTAGRYDDEARFSYRIWGVDASARVGDLTVHAEYAARRNDLEPSRFAVDRLEKSGWYVEAEHPLCAWATGVLRFDELRRDGPLHEDVAVAISERTRLRRFTAGVEVRPEDALFVKASVEHYRPSELPITNVLHLGLGTTF